MIVFSDFNCENVNSVDAFKLPLSKDYRVFVNGKEIPVYNCRISSYPFNTWWPGHQRQLSQTEIASYVNLVSDEELEIEVEPLTKTAYERIMIKPYAKNVAFEKRGNRIAFTLNENGGYLFELDDYHNLLYIFNNKPSLPDADKKATYYFGPGVHFAGKIELHSNESIYLEKDALVYGCVFAENAENIRIYGNGIFDDGTEERVFESCTRRNPNGNLKFLDCRGIRIEGIGVMNSAIWCVNLFHCNDVEINGINVFGQWRYNTDGIDVVNCKGVTLKGCFVHSFDDSIVIKGLDEYRGQSNVDMLIESCVLLCDWGRAMEIGLETECREYKNIVFRNCYIVRSGNCACDIQNGDCAEVHDITFENISVELESFYTDEQYQNNQEEKYVLQDKIMIPDVFRVSNPRFREMYAFLNGGEGLGEGDTSRLGEPSFASSRNIVLKNVSVYADDKIMKENGTNCVRIFVNNQIPTTEYKDLLVENISLNGKRLEEKDMMTTIDGCDKEALTIR